ncbi:hypothetical protein LZ30DRAFT_170587 [Colletotrichum cereale]|nr:hypothetical protein LZ30DRAFT_170587 [Colletotrichum cereale]
MLLMGTVVFPTPYGCRKHDSRPLPSVQEGGFPSTQGIRHCSKVNLAGTKSPDERSLGLRETRRPIHGSATDKTSYAGNKLSKRLLCNRRVAARGCWGRGDAIIESCGDRWPAAAPRGSDSGPRDVGLTCCQSTERTRQRAYPSTELSKDPTLRQPAIVPIPLTP